MFKRISCRLRDFIPTPSDHSFLFRKWFGRTLSKHDRLLINSLERIRRKRKIRVHIIDPPGVNSEPILISYLQFLQTLYPANHCAVYAKTKNTAKFIARQLHGKSLPCSVKRPFSLRGCNYDMALVINPPQKYLDNILRTIIPTIDDRAGCAIIILSSSPPSPLRSRRSSRDNPPNLPIAYYSQLSVVPTLPTLQLEHTIIVELSSFSPLLTPQSKQSPSAEADIKL